MVHINTDEIVVTKLAYKLANLVADELACQGGIVEIRAVSIARFLGACEVAHILGYGSTPTHVDLEIREWVRENPRPIDHSAFQKDAKAWRVKVELGLSQVLVDMYHD